MEWVRSLMIKNGFWVATYNLSRNEGNKPCPSCSQDKNVLFPYKGHDVNVEVCDTCSEEIIEAKEIRRMR